MRENTEGEKDTITSVLNEMAAEGRLRWGRKGKQTVLWSLVKKEYPGRHRSRQESWKPVPDTGSQLSRYMHAGEGTGFGVSGWLRVGIRVAPGPVGRTGGCSYRSSVR